MEARSRSTVIETSELVASFPVGHKICSKTRVSVRAQGQSEQHQPMNVPADVSASEKQDQRLLGSPGVHGVACPEDA